MGDNALQKHKDTVQAITVKENALAEQKDLRAQAVQELNDMQGKLNDVQKLKSRIKKLSQQHKDDVEQVKKMQKQCEEEKELHAKELKALKDSKRSKRGMSSRIKMFVVAIPVVLAVVGMYYFHANGI